MLRHRCSHVRKDAVPTGTHWPCCVTGSLAPSGMGNVLGNKGGVAIALCFDNTKLLFVTAHFAAHEKMLAQRNADFHRINRLLFAPKSPGTYILVILQCAPALPISARPLINAMSFRHGPGTRTPTRVAPVDLSSYARQNRDRQASMRSRQPTPTGRLPPRAWTTRHQRFTSLPPPLSRHALGTAAAHYRVCVHEDQITANTHYGNPQRLRRVSNTT